MSSEPMALSVSVPVASFTDEHREFPAPVPLSELSIGECGIIVDFKLDEKLLGCLIDIGFTPGAAVRVVRRGMMGDPTAFLIRGAVIALRSQESAGIVVERVFLP